MTILDRAGGKKRVRIDATQFADELARRLPGIEGARDAATTAVRGAAGSARQSLDRANEFARLLRTDVANASDQAAADNPVEDLAQRLRGIASTTAIRSIVARLERELPEVDRDRYDRAYLRGRVQARSRYLALGLLVGVGAGVVAAILLDPRNGRERRARIAERTGSATRDLGARVGGTARGASDRARAIAMERGMVKPAGAPAAEGVVTDPASTAWEPAPGADGGEVVETPADVTAPDAVDAASDRGTTRSIHG